MSRYSFIALTLTLTSVVLFAQPKTSAESFLHSEHNRDAFSRPAPALNAVQLRAFHFGNRIFNTNWVVAPASAAGFDGLGPTFNRVSCSGCHLRDGRGRAPIPGESELNSILVRISLPGKTALGDPKPVPGYGTQINDRAIPGVPAEAKIQIRWVEQVGRFADGSVYTLRKPLLSFSAHAFGAFPKETQTSLRVAPAVFGMGLIDALDDSAFLTLEDPLDRNRDGISGRVNRVYSSLTNGVAIGRFGWKANVATLKEQNLGAALGDIGITSDLEPLQNCPTEQLACKRAATGGAPELSAAFAEKLTQYVQMLGVPRPRKMDARAHRGRELFDEYHCVRCHVETLETGSNSSLTFLRHQRFSPFSDFLLHDMGVGLADGRADFLASASEWRTAPLWGLGLQETVNDHLFLLHDGRARGIEEAILWHGGEAEDAKNRFKNATAEDRQALVSYLKTL